MNIEKILNFIEIISPHAREFVKNGFENNEVELIYSLDTSKNKGILIKVENEAICIFYASFLNDENLDEVLSFLNTKMQDSINERKHKEICFNVYGKNQKIIHQVRQLGFKSDIEGFHLELKNQDFSIIHHPNLIIKGFETEKIEDFIELFDQSYYQLNLDNEWPIHYYREHKEAILDEFDFLNKQNQIHSFWLNDELIGASIFEKNYITDLVVKPNYQNQGFGSIILHHCVETMKSKPIRLRVAKSNVQAKKFYERHHFIEIACFAEHTFKPKC